jgi:RimJ/RimL family protein N-acetyltransferase
MNDKIELITERLKLRPIEQKDSEAIFKYRSDSITNKYQGWIPETINDVNDFISKVSPTIDVFDSWFQFAIIENVTKKIIGDVGIHFIDCDNKQAEIGCTLDKSQHGKGFATEVMKATIDYLFNKLNKHRIIASLDPQNTKSIELVERVGFRKEGHFRESIFVNGEWSDDLVYAILEQEWNHKV